MFRCSSALPLFMVTGVVCLTSTLAWWRSPITIVNEQRCTPEYCFGLDYESIADVYYRGVFQTEWESMQELAQRPSNQRSQTRFRRDSEWDKTDYDYCCPTIVSHRKENHLQNIFGQWKAIVQMEHLEAPRYQFIPYAKCPENIGGCWATGSCKIQNITVGLLVYKMGKSGWPFEFSSFQVPGYCSCKSN